MIADFASAIWTLDAELKPIIHACNSEVMRMRNSLIACSHSNPAPKYRACAQRFIVPHTQFLSPDIHRSSVTSIIPTSPPAFIAKPRLSHSPSIFWLSVSTTPQILRNRKSLATSIVRSSSLPPIPCPCQRSVNIGTQQSPRLARL